MEPGKSRRRTSGTAGYRRKRAAVKTVLALLLLVVILCLVLAIVRNVTGLVSRLLLDVETVQAGLLTETVPVQAMIVRQETTVASPDAGRFENIVAERQRVRRGTPVGYLYLEGGRRRAISSPVTGMVSFVTDGLEESLQEFDFASADPGIFSYASRPRQVVGEGVERGMVLFRVVDNLAPVKLVICAAFPARLGNLSQGQRMAFRQGNKDWATGEVEAVKERPEYTMALVSLSPDDNLVAGRFPHIEAVVKSSMGLLVPRCSIVVNGGNAGVYILKKGMPRYVKVRILDQNADKAIVEGIKEGDLVVTTPGRVIGGT